MRGLSPLGTVGPPVASVTSVSQTEGLCSFILLSICPHTPPRNKTLLGALRKHCFVLGCSVNSPQHSQPLGSPRACSQPALEDGSLVVTPHLEFWVGGGIFKVVSVRLR